MKKIATLDTIKKLVKCTKQNFIRTTDPMFRQPSTAYSANDIVYIRGAGAGYRLSCVKAGTTSADELSTSLKTGQYITDGSVTWIVEDVRDGDRVGDISLHPTLLAGHILADGSTVKASDYPRLLAWVQENSMTGTDDAHYTYDESADTLKVPNASGRVLQGGTGVATKSAGLPNITGNVGGELIEHASITPSGAFKVVSSVGGFDGGGGRLRNVDFDASRSNPIYGNSDTVQPPAITMLAQIKY